MAANYRLRRLNRLKWAENGVKRGVMQPTTIGGCKRRKKQKSLRKRVDLPRTMFYYNNVLKKDKQER